MDTDSLIADRGDPALTARQVRSGLLQGFWKILEARTDAATVSRIIAAAGVPEAMARDASGWLSYAYYDRLNRVVAQELYGLSEPPGLDHELWQLWRQTPTHAMEAMGAIIAMFRAFSATERMYQAIANLAAMGNTGIEVRHVGLGPGLARYEVRARDDPAAVGPATVWKVYGWLESMQTIWGHPPAAVKMWLGREGGQPVYHYRVGYRHASTDRRAIAGLTVVGAGLGLLLAPWVATPVAVGAVSGAAITLALAGWRRIVRRTVRAERDGERIQALIEELDARYVEVRRALLATRKLSGYLAADLVDEIVEHPEAERRLGGKSTSAAVLFADIVGFTPRCEARAAEAIVRELNTYFSLVDPVYAARGGVIDKRIGDGMMVVFTGRGVREPEQVCHDAVRAGIEALRAVERCNEVLAEQGAPPIQVRVGVAYGPLIQGNMGSSERLEYTVIGDIVNLAARLESSAEAAHVLVEGDTFARATAYDPLDARVASRREIRVKGKQHPIPVVELAPAEGGTRDG